MVSLTMQEAQRYKVISEMKEGYLKVREAAEILGLSQRQVYRIKARFGKEGPKGIIHRSKGKKTPRWLREKVRDKIDHLYKTKYRGFNLTHMTEFLNQEEGIKVSRESVRQILLGKGSYVEKRRYPKHRRWREPTMPFLHIRPSQVNIELGRALCRMSQDLLQDGGGGEREPNLWGRDSARSQNSHKSSMISRRALVLPCRDSSPGRLCLQRL